MQPTFQRRRRYLLTKEFTCHCPRCDAPGDDTRQFECEQSNCPGFHLMRYPVDAGGPELGDLKYTGVLYEEPHLLPCNVCQHRPSVAFERRCSEIERQLPNLDRAIAKEMEHALKGAVPVHYTALRSMLSNIKYPKRHVYSEQALETEMLLRTYETKNNPDKQLAVSAMMDMVRLFDDVLGPYNMKSATCQASFGTGLLLDRKLSRKSLHAVRNILQAALRTHLIIKGRESDDETRSLLTDSLLQTMERLGSSGDSEGGGENQSATKPACAFCGESPTSAAMVERYCLGCGGTTTMYCSEACQKAHLPLHRKRCAGKAPV